MTSVTLPLIDHSIRGENHLKNLTYIVRKPKGANAPPKATRLTKQRFSIFIAGGEENGNELPNLAVNGLNQQSSNDEIKLEKLDFLPSSSSSTNLFNQEKIEDGENSNSLVSISILKIKGFSSSTPLEEDQISTVQNLFNPSNSHTTLVNGELDINDDVWNDFHDSQKLKNNLEVLLICKKMNLNFEVARNQNMPGMLVIPKFHCPRCYEAWKKDLQVPQQCDHPENPVRGAPIALDQRAHVFLKDQNISYIEVRGSQTMINKRFQKLNQSSIWRASSMANKRSQQTNDLSTDSGARLRPKSQASAISIQRDERSPTTTRGMDEEFDGITEVNITNGEKMEGGGIRTYGGLTNSQARVFMKDSLLDAKASKSKQHLGKHVKDSKKKSSKEGLFKSSRRSRKNHKTTKKGGTTGQNTDERITTSSDNQLADLATDSTTGEHQKDSSDRSTTKKQNENRRQSVVQNNILLTINPEDTASEIFTKVKQRKPTLKSKQPANEEKKQNNLQSISSVNSTQTTAIGQGNTPESVSHLRRASIQSRSDQQYVMQGAGAGNNLKTRNDGRRRSLKTRVANNQYGMGFVKRRSGQSDQLNGDEDGDEENVDNNEEEEAKFPVRMRNNNLNGTQSSRRSSSVGSRTKVNVNQKHKDGKGDYDLPPVEVSKKSKVGSADILRALNSAGSASGSSSSISGTRDRPTSRTHSRCLDASFSTDLYDSNGNLISSNSGYHDSMKNKTTKSGQPISQVRKRNIFFASRFLCSKDDDGSREEITMVTDRTMLTPSPKLGPKFPQYDLMALRISNRTSGATFSYYKYPAQYKKHYEFVKSKAQNPSKASRKIKSPKKKK